LGSESFKNPLANSAAKDGKKEERERKRKERERKKKKEKEKKEKKKEEKERRAKSSDWWKKFFILQKPTNQRVPPAAPSRIKENPPEVTGYE